MTSIALPAGRRESPFGPYETVNLALPFVLFAAVAYHLATSAGPTEPEKEFVLFLRNFLFFQATHVAFTFFMMVSLPEFRSFIRASLKERSRWIWGALLFFVGMPSIIWIQRTEVLGELGNKLIFAVPAFFFFRHGIMQIFGISLLYGAGLKAAMSIENRERTSLLEKRERIWFKVLAAPIVLYPFYVQFPQMQSSTLEHLFIAAMLVPSLVILWTAYRFPGEGWGRKRIFLLRILFYPLMGVSYLMGAVLGALHGVEYSLLAMNMISKSNASAKSRFWLVLPAVLIVLTIPYLVVRSPQYLTGFCGTACNGLLERKENLILLVVTVDYLHYYLDGIFFRMSEAKARGHIGPLLGIPVAQRVS